VHTAAREHHFFSHELETERLRLVMPTEAHLDAFYALYSDPEVMAHVTEPKSRSEVWEILSRRIGHWYLRGYGGWAVLAKEHGGVIGTVGIMHPAGTELPEVGWVFGRACWGKGYASEAAAAMLDYAANIARLDRVMARIRPDNAGSLRLAAKLGLVTDVRMSRADDTVMTLDLRLLRDRATA
jgi:RimJ/RimL family protein N-acetyltransferase